MPKTADFARQKFFENLRIRHFRSVEKTLDSILGVRYSGKGILE